MRKPGQNLLKTIRIQYDQVDEAFRRSESFGCEYLFFSASPIDHLRCKIRVLVGTQTRAYDIRRTSSPVLLVKSQP